MLTIDLEASNIVERQEKASVIGEVREEPVRMVIMHTGFGGTRMSGPIQFRMKPSSNDNPECVSKQQVRP